MPDPVSTLSVAVTNVLSLLKALPSLLPSGSPFEKQRDVNALLTDLRASKDSLHLILSLASRLLEIEDVIERVNTELSMLSDSAVAPNRINTDHIHRLRKTLEVLLDRELEMQLKQLLHQIASSDVTTLLGYETDSLIEQYRHAIRSLRNLLNVSPPSSIEATNLATLIHQLTELSYLSKALAKTLIKSLEQLFAKIEIPAVSST